MEILVALAEVFGSGGIAGLVLFLILIFVGAPMAGVGLLVRGVWRAGERLMASQKEQLERILQEHKDERMAEAEQWRQVVDGQSAAIDNLANAVRMISGQSELVPIRTSPRRSRANGRAARA